MKEQIGFIGAGNMCQTLVAGWLGQKLVDAKDIAVSNRTPGKVKKLVDQFAITGCATNEEVVDQANVVILAMKPQDLVSAVEPIASTFRADQIVVSLAAGVRLGRLRKILPQCQHLVRVMANTPARVQKGAFAYCTRANNLVVDRLMERLFQPLGMIVRLEEGDTFEAFTVATSAGVGFVLELMQYWQEWMEERGVEPAVASQMTIQTFAGAAELAKVSWPRPIEELQSQVVSKKGVTHAGLNSLRELELERLLRISFEKAAIRERELAQDE